ncbi:MAG: hypothetical protein OXC29_01040 [Rhodococcus sp.]|nr:hypothetical protein [Rhodococcus sp. (in: high G+C Gram-positive bacteria)]
MNDARAAQQHKADARPKIVVCGYDHQRLVGRIREVDQIYDKHGIDQLLFRARQHAAWLYRAVIKRTSAFTEEGGDGGYGAA